MRTAGIRSINSTTGAAIAAALTELEPLVFSVAPTSLVKTKIQKTMLISCEIKKNCRLKRKCHFDLLLYACHYHWKLLVLEVIVRRPSKTDRIV